MLQYILLRMHGICVMLLLCLV